MLRRALFSCPRSRAQRSGKPGDGDSQGSPRLEQWRVACDEDEAWISEALGGRKVYCVISAQPMHPGQITGPTCERLIDFDDVYLGEERVELIHCRPEVLSGEMPETLGLSKRRGVSG